jgi:hypothetical protein
MTLHRTLATGLILGLLAAAPAGAAVVSKTYAFKPNTLLQVGVEMEGGLRLDTIEFVLTQDDGSPSGLFSGPKVKVAISNLGTASVKVDIAVAVFDDGGRLVGVASGGTKLFPLRPDRQMTYMLDFDRAAGELSSGTSFKITIESKP